MMSAVRHVMRRRATLRQRFDPAREMATIEETCIPSYLHPNPLAAGVAWMRLFAAMGLLRRYAPAGTVLDFGAAAGELAHLMPADRAYEFVEIDMRMAQALQRAVPSAVQRDGNALPAAYYAAICALDSLEHNDDVGSIVDRLLPALRADGVLILSGPTESALYRLGRRVAGFSGAYHKTNIYDIEAIVARSFHVVQRRVVPLGLGLFSVSCWRPK